MWCNQTTLWCQLFNYNWLECCEILTGPEVNGGGFEVADSYSAQYVSE